MIDVDEETLQAFTAGRIGYGNLDAPYWLLGREEHTDAPVVEIPLRLQGPPLEDLHAAHEKLPEGLQWFGEKPSLQATWHKLIVALLTATGRPAEEADVRAYQATKLGRTAGETLMMTLYPLPAQGIKAPWPYADATDLPHLATRAAYEEDVWLARAAWLQKLAKEHHPKWVLGYGKQLWPKFKRIFGSAKFQPIPMEPKAWGEFAWAVLGTERTLVTLAPDPTTQGTASKLSNWVSLGAFVRGELKGS